MDTQSKKYASAEQKLRLATLVEADPQLRSGKFSTSFTKSEAKKRWIYISEDINSLTGAKKTWEEWRKTWQDRKAHAKKKFAALRRQANITGGGPPPESATLEETLVLNTIDQPSLVGHTDSQESVATFIDLSQPGTVGVECKPIIDMPPPEAFADQESSNKENIAPKHNLKFKKKRTVAQRRLQQGVDAAETLNERMKEKNDLKKKFYEEIIKLNSEYVKSMTTLTQAMVDIAAALINKECNCSNVDKH